MQIASKPLSSKAAAVQLLIKKDGIAPDSLSRFGEKDYADLEKKLNFKPGEGRVALAELIDSFNDSEGEKQSVNLHTPLMPGAAALSGTAIATADDLTMDRVQVALSRLGTGAKDGTAGQHIVIADNAWIQSYVHSYGTRRAKETNLLTQPHDGKLKLTVVMGVSGDSGEASKFATDPKEKWNIVVTGPTGTTRWSVESGGTPSKPAYSFAKDIEIDVSKPGTYTIDTSPFGSDFGEGGEVPTFEPPPHDHRDGTGSWISDGSLVQADVTRYPLLGTAKYIEGRRTYLNVGEANFFKPLTPAGGSTQSSRLEVSYDETADLDDDVSALHQQIKSKR